MKMYYLNFVFENELGVIKKIKYQKKALKKRSVELKLESCIKKNIFYLNGLKINNFNNGTLLKGKILRKTNLYQILIKLSKNKYYNEIDLVYIRYIQSSYFFNNYLKFLKKLGKKIVLEIPTYPYDNEIEKENIFTKWDKKYRLELYKYIDKIVTYSDDKYIWNIPCINISNGIDLEEIKLVEKKKHNSINFISVSNCSFWHGIDRFLYSLLQYRKNGGKEKIKFYIVGEGTETAKLKKIVEDNIELQDIVIFYGFKIGEELDEIYNNSDIGIGALASFRQGTNYGSSLKGAEYCAKGIPFVLGAKDNRFINCDFSYLVSNDESLLDIEKIIEWYKNLKITSEEIRKYAEDNLTWDKQMKKVIDNI